MEQPLPSGRVPGTRPQAGSARPTRVCSLQPESDSRLPEARGVPGLLRWVCHVTARTRDARANSSWSCLESQQSLSGAAELWDAGPLTPALSQPAFPASGCRTDSCGCRRDPDSDPRRRRPPSHLHPLLSSGQRRPRLHTLARRGAGLHQPVPGRQASVRSCDTALGLLHSISLPTRLLGPGSSVTSSERW